MAAKFPLTILTPTYNRCDKLPRLYESLCKQTNVNFQWLVIDDGSTDDTEKYIHSLPKTAFQLDYYKKPNGGKHTALNFAHPHLQGELVCIVDSDDYLVPRAVETIIQQWQPYKDKTIIGGMSFCKCYANGILISRPLPQDPLVSDHIRYRINGFVSGDRCEVIRTDLFKQCVFPTFAGERFMSESKLWVESAIGHQTVYRDIPLYVAEYLEGGLSKSGRALRMKNPFGMMENCKVFFIPQVNWKVQIKEMWLYWVYGLCAKLSPAQIAARSGRPVRMWLNFPFGLALYLYWKKKYL